MKRFRAAAKERSAWIRDEKGMSLVETLTALMILGMVASILYSFLLMGVSVYKRVTVETQMRNQGDSLYSRIISELKDAVYVDQVIGTTNAIRYVKRSASSDPKQYIERYEMTLEPNPSAGGRIVVKRLTPPETTRTYRMTRQFTISAGELLAENNRLVHVRLVYSRSDASSLKPAENPQLEIRSQIPLFRNE